MGELRAGTESTAVCARVNSLNKINSRLDSMSALFITFSLLHWMQRAAFNVYYWTQWFVYELCNSNNQSKSSSWPSFVVRCHVCNTQPLLKAPGFIPVLSGKLVWTADRHGDNGACSSWRRIFYRRMPFRKTHPLGRGVFNVTPSQSGRDLNTDYTKYWVTILSFWNVNNTIFLLIAE